MRSRRRRGFQQDQERLEEALLLPLVILWPSIIQQVRSSNIQRAIVYHFASQRRIESLPFAILNKLENVYNNAVCALLFVMLTHV